MSYERHTATHKAGASKLSSDKRAERMRRALIDRLHGKFSEASVREVNYVLAESKGDETTDRLTPVVCDQTLRNMNVFVSHIENSIIDGVKEQWTEHSTLITEDVVVRKVNSSEMSKPSSLGKKVTIKDYNDHVIVFGVKS